MKHSRYGWDIYMYSVAGGKKIYRVFKKRIFLEIYYPAALRWRKLLTSSSILRHCSTRDKSSCHPALWTACDMWRL